MPQLLTVDDLKEALRATYSRETLYQSKDFRLSNINSFLDINRDGLTYNLLERQILLYTTLAGEKIYIQLPGKESVNAIPMLKDFRPKLRCADGTLIKDTSFGDIWDILDEIRNNHRNYLGIVAAMFFRMGYMYEYSQTCDNCNCVVIQIEGDNIIELPHPEVSINWYHMNISDDIWYSLNNYIGNVHIPDDKTITFEAFIKYIDLLLQNEDCKYYYKKAVLRTHPEYKLENGRTPTCDVNLAILHYLEGHSSISSLLNNFQQTRGVPRLQKEKYPIVTDGIVTKR